MRHSIHCEMAHRNTELHGGIRCHEPGEWDKAPPQHGKHAYNPCTPPMPQTLCSSTEVLNFLMMTSITAQTIGRQEQENGLASQNSCISFCLGEKNNVMGTTAAPT